MVLDLIKRNVRIHELDLYGNNCMHYLFSVFAMNEEEAKKILYLLVKNGINGNH